MPVWSHVRWCWADLFVLAGQTLRIISYWPAVCRKNDIIAVCTDGTERTAVGERFPASAVSFYIPPWVISFPTLKDKSVPLQAWSGPEGSRKLRFPDFMTTTQDGGKVSLTHRPPLPQEMLLVIICVRGWVDSRATVRSEGFYVNENFQGYQLESNQWPSN